MTAKKKSDGAAKKAAPGKKSTAPRNPNAKAAPKKAKTKDAGAASGRASVAAGCHPGCLTAHDNGDNSFTVFGEGDADLSAAYRIDSPPASSDPRTLVADSPGPGSLTVVCKPIKATDPDNEESVVAVTVNLTATDSQGPGPFVLTVSARVVADENDGSLSVQFTGSTVAG